METLFHRIVTIPQQINKIGHDVTRRAMWAANIAAFLWFYYCIGLWYASKFLPAEKVLETGPYFLFGALFVVWFAVFWGYISGVIIKKTYLEG